MKADSAPDEFSDALAVLLSGARRGTSRDGHNHRAIAGVKLAPQAGVDGLQQLLTHGNEARLPACQERTQDGFSLRGTVYGKCLDTCQLKARRNVRSGDDDQTPHSLPFT